MKIGSFHENQRFSKDHLQGIVTPMFSYLNVMIFRVNTGQAEEGQSGKSDFVT